MTTVAEEAIVGVNVVKAFAQEAREEERFGARNEAVFDESVRATRQRAFYVPLLSFLPLLAQAAVLLAGGHLVVNGDLDDRRLRRLQRLRPHAGHAAADARHVDRPGPSARPPRASGSSRSWTSRRRSSSGPTPYRSRRGRGRPALRARDVRLRPRAAGPPRRRPGDRARARRWRSSGTRARARPRSRRSSRASTTSARDACSSTASTSATCDLTELRRSIGIVSQDPFLFSTTVRENIAFGDPLAAERGDIVRAARMAQAQDFVLALPERYDTVIGERGHHALGRPASAARDRPRHPRGPPRADPRRRHRLGGRDHRGADPPRPARGDEGPDDAHRRAPPLDHLARRRDRRPRARTRGRARDAGGARRRRAPSTATSSEHGLRRARGHGPQREEASAS